MENKRKIEENKSIRNSREINEKGYGYKSGYGKESGHGKGNGNEHGYGNRGRGIEYKVEEISEERGKRGNRNFGGHENSTGKGVEYAGMILGKGVCKNMLGRNKIEGEGGLGEVRENLESISRGNDRENKK